MLLLCVHQAGVGHIVFSTLEDVRKHIPKGAMPELGKEPGRVVAHFESKDAVMVGAVISLVCLCEECAWLCLCFIVL